MIEVTFISFVFDHKNTTLTIWVIVQYNNMAF